MTAIAIALMIRRTKNESDGYRQKYFVVRAIVMITIIGFFFKTKRFPSNYMRTGQN